MKELERENSQLNNAESELTLARMILKEALERNDQASSDVDGLLSSFRKSWGNLYNGYAA